MVDTSASPHPVPISPIAEFYRWASCGSWLCDGCGRSAYWVDQYGTRHCAACEPLEHEDLAL